MKVTIDIPGLDGTIASTIKLGRTSIGPRKSRWRFLVPGRKDQHWPGSGRMLNMSVYEAEGFMKERNIESPYSYEDYKKDQVTLARLLKS